MWAGGALAGFVDWDTASPSRREDDLAFSALTWGPRVAMIRQFADGGEPVFQRMLPWAADLERSGNEVAELPDEFWPGPGRWRRHRHAGA